MAARWVLASAAVMLAGTAAALSPDLQLTQFTHKSWRAGEDRFGLPQNSVFSIAQTGDGYLWLATQEGLVRFDGVRFKSFNSSNTPAITHNDVWKLLPGPEGLWVATRGGGLLRYSLGRFASWTTEDGLAGNTIHAIWRDTDGSLWIGTASGLSHLQWLPGGGAKIRNFDEADGLSANTIYAVFRDSAGQLYIGTDSAGVNVLNPHGRFEAFQPDSDLRQATTYSIQQDGDGTLWIGTGNGLFSWRAGELQRHGEAQGLSNDNVRTIHEDQHGNLWIGTNGGGINRLVAGRFEHFGSEHGLTNDQVGAIAEDREGNLWIGTDGGGLNRLNDSKFIPYGVPEGLSNDNVRAVMQGRDGSLWVGTFGGINIYQNQQFRSIRKADGLSSDIILSLEESADGSIWAGTLDAGLNHIQDGRISHISQADGLIGRSVLSLLEDRDGALWIGTRGSGLSRLQGGRIDSFTMESVLPNNSIRVIKQTANGDIWLGTLGGGLVRYRDGQFTTFGVDQGLSNGRIFALHEDADQVLWIGTFGGGLNRYSNGEFHHFGMADGLHDDSIFQILEDADGNLWLSSNRGISRVSKQQLADFAAGRETRLTPTVYGQWDGMRSREANGGHQPAGWRASDGLLWFPTIRGLVSVDPQNLVLNLLPPPVIIEKVLVDGQAVTGNGPIALPAGSKKLEFRFTALSFTAPENVRFRHYLEGFDDGWQEDEDQRTAQYTNLPPGDYIFRVTAMNNDGIWNQSGAIRGVKKQAFFYQQPYFFLVYLLAALSLVAAAFRLHRLRIKRLQARQRELMQLVQQREQASAALKAANDSLRGQVEELAREEAAVDVPGERTTDLDLAELIDRSESDEMTRLVKEFRDTLSTLAAKERQLKATRMALAQSTEQLKNSNRTIKRYVPEQVAHRIMSGRHVSQSAPEWRLITVFHAEIGGFGAGRDEASAEQAASLLNTYLTELSRVADRYYATIGNISGDSLTILFGAPEGVGPGADAQGAVMMSLEMLARTRELQRDWQSQGIAQLPELRAGINTGHASVGDFGPEWRKAYTAVGQTARIARQIQEHCPANMVLISQSTQELVRSEVLTERFGSVNVPAAQQPLDMFRVVVADTQDTAARESSAA